MPSAKPVGRTVHRLLRLVGALGLGVVMTVSSAPPANAAMEPIYGAGSTWSQVAIEQWARDVASRGIKVNYGGVGSTQGRLQFLQQTLDFGVSEIPFQPPYRDPNGVLIDELEQARARNTQFSYLPIVAGGTSFMYRLTIRGQLVRNLQLSAPTLAKIFTGQIKVWNHPDIKADNPQIPNLPATPITPVVRSDGSGTSAQFSLYMAKQTGDIWKSGMTSDFPAPPGAKAQQGSDGVANWVAAGYGEGAITYVEYAYAKQRNFPVASVKNVSGKYVQPTSDNVAIALTKVKLAADSTQDLTGVYTMQDPRAYPVSSYSYMIVPTNTFGRFNTGKGETLGKFIKYFLCDGQKQVATLGYSPLPPQLVSFGYAAIKKIPGAPDPGALPRDLDNVTQAEYDACPNPTFRPGFVKPIDDKTNGSTGGGTSGGSGGTTGGGGTGGTGDAGGTGGTGGTTDGATGGSPDASGGTPAQDGTGYDPATGEVVDSGGGSGGNGGGGIGPGGVKSAGAVDLDGPPAVPAIWFYVLAIGCLALAVGGGPALYSHLDRRRAAQHGGG